MDNAAIVALNRFGFGRRPDQLLSTNPRDWLRGQLTGPDPTPLQGTVDTNAALLVVRDYLTQKRERKAAMAQANASTAGLTGQTSPGAPSSMNQPAGNAAGEMANPVRLLAKQEIHDLLGNALITPAPFRERLVWFWANHFTIAAKGAVTGACCGSYIREAIRPHVTGRFCDMLLAVMRHPAMISYLNQERSAGPDSLAGQRHHIGLNENLARESLELHTVSPASGYTQQDVTNYARVLTGWSIDIQSEQRGFLFRPNLHEPGEITVMGQTWPAGEQGGIAILNWLGTQPATYRHLAAKLACHFVADEPAQADIHRIETVLRDTQGDLGAASAAMVELPGAWVPGTKLRTPQDYVIACLRAIDAKPDRVPNLAQVVGGLGQGMFQAPFPIGWPDKAADWSGPEAMLERVDFAYSVSGRVATLDPEALGHDVLGPLLTADTLGQLRAAGSRRDGLTLLMASPEFQRR